jgi:hypothetical protein
MRNLADQRCFNHAEREAVARCPACTQFFCRECITEHDDRVLCAACLRQLSRVPLFRRRSFAKVLRVGQLLFGLLAAWLFFYLLGNALLSIPDSFHEGELWRPGWLDHP